MASNDLIQKRDERDAKVDQYARAFEQAKNSGAANDRAYDDEKLANALGVQVKDLGDEMTRRRREIDALSIAVETIAAKESIDGVRVTPASTQTQATAPSVRKGLGTMFVESKAYTERTSRVSATLPIDVKTLMQSDGAAGGGWAPFSADLPGFTSKAVRPTQIIDFIPRFRTTQSAIPFMEETTHTDNAVEKAQGAAAGEQAYVFTRQSRTVERIPASIPVTDEQLDDVVAIEDFLNQALTKDVLRRLDLQCMAGNGTTPNLAGILDHADIQTQAKGADPAFDAFLKAITKVRVTGRAAPNVVFIHSTDWQGILLTRTADGLYILGNPAGPNVDRLWGLPVVANEANSAGTAVTGDTGYTGLYIRQDVTFQIGLSGTQFVEGEKTCLATLRAAMVVRRGTAFCTVTGL